ncbi:MULTISPECIES: class II aldolase/adducin family protein [unclassified Crossiella]|uniref:class II aldolase/adducin family protein n=1 Tax=unclassified Crossiella TaxID=2620835 RepID=UPI001FFE6D95|nr:MULTISPECIES: class II aldolase/adducin family protein [unclassified Crossiella]MCK2237608.1 class II aldolase/adducin family protein [Crossiella sp. S99.2]MCK2254894.1 class II aldolase/adducin family protein [Crossiella sp. S99.1]
MRYQAQREAVVTTCRRLVEQRLVVGTAGNVSLRVDDLVLVTPSGVDYDQLTPEQVGLHRLDGRAVEAELAPTSELPMHQAIYAAGAARAVVHTHSVAATALSCLVEEIPPIHYYLGIFGGAVRVAPYAPYGSPELAAATVTALGGSSACLLGNHGAVTVAGTLAHAFRRAAYLEWLCEVALRVLGTGITARTLFAAELAEVTPRIQQYGQHPGDEI